MLVISIEKKEMKRAYKGQAYNCSKWEEEQTIDVQEYNKLLVRILLMYCRRTESEPAA